MTVSREARSSGLENLDQVTVFPTICKMLAKKQGSVGFRCRYNTSVKRDKTIALSQEDMTVCGTKKMLIRPKRVKFAATCSLKKNSNED